MVLRTNNLSIELVGREISGRPVPGRPRRPAGPYLLGLPALLLSSLLLIPVGVTVVAAFRLPDGSFGFGNFAVMADPAALHAVGNSLAWVAVAFGLVVLGFLLALVSYRLPAVSSFLQPALVIPFAVSVLVSGATFRLIFDPTPERGTVTAVWTKLFGTSPVWLGPGMFWLVLVSAFGWTWLGYVVSLFRAGLDAIPDDVSRTIQTEGVTGWRRLRVLELPLLRPITGVVTLTLVIAAVRVFDLVLILVPGSLQQDADVLGINWWRSSAGGTSGRTAALGVVLFAIVAAVGVIGVRGLRRRRWAMPVSVVTAERSVRRPRPSRRTRRVGSTVGFAVALFWILPAIVLVATALHSPTAAGLDGWWSARGFGFESFAAAANVGLLRALLSTLLISSIATVVLLVIAVPTAYLVAWGGLPPWLGRVVTSVFVVLAVTPVQMYAAPLRDAIGAAGLAGSRVALALVHAAAGLPFAVLLLRSAFASAPPVLVAEALQGPARQSAVLATVRRTYRPALVAVAVLEFVLVWNDFIVGFLISGPGSTPLSLVLWGEARQFSASAGTVAAAAVVASIVPVVLLLSFWRTVVRGLTVGSRP
ncbi:alpha-glucoside transport system permease protein [Kribbella amoyensis]|uniref:Alpha-glucoside transport system permease protein n=1 Tax=Kribbella amoyensis TaxID=996641 RepID=A0A561BLU9_9ACTN|nr:ABC transporter permease subunit [Kribbella amoyensis]TWD79813.1 alpha-glucoside transport system permease protein [Kribbella amoyensis]